MSKEPPHNPERKEHFPTTKLAETKVLSEEPVVSIENIDEPHYNKPVPEPKRLA